MDNLVSMPSGDAGATSESIENRIAAAMSDEPEKKELQPGEEPPIDESEVEEEDAPSDEDEVSLSSYLGLQDGQVFQDEDGNVMINTKVDGVEQAVPMAEVVKSYQLQKHITQKSMQVSAQQKQVQEEQVQFYHAAQEKFHILDTMTDALEGNFISEYQKIDWARLRQVNPAEYVASQKDFEQAVAQLKEAREYTVQQRQQLEAIKEQQIAQAMDSHLVNQTTLVLQHNPAWADPVVRDNETSQMRKFLRDTYGYQDNELDAITDHRQIKVIQDAMKVAGIKNISQNKLAKPLPKFQKSGMQAVEQPKQLKDGKLKAQLKRSGNVRDLASVLESRM